MGNVTVAIVKRGGGPAGRLSVLADFTLSNSYATNGDTIVAADIAALLPSGEPLTDVLLAIFEDGQAGHAISLDRTNKKLKVFNGTAEIANATNLSAVTVRGELQYRQGTGPV